LKQLKSGNLAPEGFLQQEMLQSKLTETHLPSTLFPYKNRFFRSYIETIIKEQKPGSNRFSQQEMLQSKLTTKTSPLAHSCLTRIASLKAILKQLRSKNLPPDGFLQQEMLQSNTLHKHFLPSILFPDEKIAIS
jgi:hypothetical protein